MRTYLRSFVWALASPSDSDVPCRAPAKRSARSLYPSSPACQAAGFGSCAHGRGGTAGVKPQIPGTWLALSDAIGGKRRRVADALDLHEKTVEAMCRPQVGDDLASQGNTGRHNLLDDLLELRRHAEHPEILDAFYAQHVGALLIRAGHSLVASAALLQAEVDQIGIEERRSR